MITFTILNSRLLSIYAWNLDASPQLISVKHLEINTIDKKRELLICFKEHMNDMLTPHNFIRFLNNH